MKSLKIKNFGPIINVDVKFGDLTFLVGPQASGKSLFLELLKYVIDKEFVLSTLRKYNYIIDKKNPQKVLDTFFGDGMNKIFPFLAVNLYPLKPLSSIFSKVQLSKSSLRCSSVGICHELPHFTCATSYFVLEISLPMFVTSVSELPYR